MLSRLVDLVAPPACAACGAPPPRRDEPLCAACRAGLPWLGDPRCARCALPVPCGPPCPAAAAAFGAAWAPLAHAGAARRLVARAKFDGAIGVCDLLASLIAAQVPEPLVHRAALVPVPGDPLRRRTRGVDHAAVLAERLAAKLEIPVAPVLRRTRPVARRAPAGRALRSGTAHHVRADGPAPAVALLVDDVHTTGTTLHAAAVALREAGAAEVRAVTATRTLHMHRHRR